MFDFPNAPATNQTYLGYIWDGEKWTSNATLSPPSPVPPPVADIRVSMFTASGTYTPDPKLIVAVVEVVGGGGAGGSTNVGTASASCGGLGGGAGGYVRATAKFTAPQIVTIGAAGAPGAAGNVAGGAGGTTTFGSLYSATGGGGGGGGGQSAGTVIGATIGGLGSGGDLNVRGMWSIGGAVLPTNLTVLSGAGGSGPYGAGGGPISNNAGRAASGFGAGGGGAGSFLATGPFVGGAGAPGLVIVTEYCSA